MWKALINLINKFGCHHEWILEKELLLYHYSTSKNPYKMKRIYCCKKCGKFKNIF